MRSIRNWVKLVSGGGIECRIAEEVLSGFVRWHLSQAPGANWVHKICNNCMVHLSPDHHHHHHHHNHNHDNHNHRGHVDCDYDDKEEEEQQEEEQEEDDGQTTRHLNSGFSSKIQLALSTFVKYNIYPDFMTHGIIKWISMGFVVLKIM